MIVKEMLSKINLTNKRISKEIELSAEVFKINTSLRMAHFLSQVNHESQGFSRLEENLNYSTEILLRVFHKYFNFEEAQRFAYKKEDIANRVYANRLGNGNSFSGDGYKYRGRGAIQLTGKFNYEEAGKFFNEDFLNNPDLLQTEEWAIKTAMWFWAKKKLNEAADEGATNRTIAIITRIVNGGLTHLRERIELFKTYNSILNT